MKEITIKMYEYGELTEDARRRAYTDWLNTQHEYSWTNEVRDTLKGLEEEFGIEVTKWSYDSSRYFVGPIRFNRLSDAQLDLFGERARAFLWNNFGHLVIQPSVKYYAVHKDGRKDYSGAIHCDSGWMNRSRQSKVFFDRTYDGTCPLTGVSFDCDALEPLAYFCLGVKWDEKAKRRVMVPHDERWRWGVTTVEDVIRHCVNSLFESAVKDCEYRESEEYFAELCEANGWTFEKNGKRRDYDNE